MVDPLITTGPYPAPPEFDPDDTGTPPPPNAGQTRPVRRGQAWRRGYRGVSRG